MDLTLIGQRPSKRKDLLKQSAKCHNSTNLVLFEENLSQKSALRNGKCRLRKLIGQERKCEEFLCLSCYRHRL